MKIYSVGTSNNILSWTLSYLKPFKYKLLLYLALGMIMIWCEITIPMYIGQLTRMVTAGITLRLVEHLTYLCGVVIAFVLAKAYYTFLEMEISIKISENQQVDLLTKLYELGYSYTETASNGELLSLFQNSVKETQQAYTFLLPQLVYCTAQFIVPTIILINEIPQLFVASLVGHALFILINRFTTKRIESYQAKETNAAHKSQKSMYDAIFSTEGLRLMNSEKWYLDKTIDEFKDYRQQRMGSLFWRHFRFTTVGISLTVSMALFYLIGRHLVLEEVLGISELIGYIFLMGIASRGFSIFFYIVPAFKHALKYAGNLYSFLLQQPCVKDVSLSDYAKSTDEVSNIGEYNNTISAIEFRNVSFKYDEGPQILNNISLIIPCGKRTAIVGESGSGKSTLFKLIGRFYDVTSGEIRLTEESQFGTNTREIKRIGLKHLRERIGFVLQDNHLFNTSILENIRFGKPSASDDEVINAAKCALVHDFVMDMPRGYDTVIGEKGAKLSGGQKQRLAIARLILKAPEILLLDEATSALDELTQSELITSLNALTKDKTVVAIAHRLSTITDYDHIVFLKAGKIVEQGDYQSLIKRQGYFYELMMRGERDVV